MCWPLRSSSPSHRHASGRPASQACSRPVTYAVHESGCTQQDSWSCLTPRSMFCIASESCAECPLGRSRRLSHGSADDTALTAARGARTSPRGARGCDHESTNAFSNRQPPTAIGPSHHRDWMPRPPTGRIIVRRNRHASPNRRNEAVSCRAACAPRRRTLAVGRSRSLRLPGARGAVRRARARARGTCLRS